VQCDNGSVFEPLKISVGINIQASCTLALNAIDRPP
jgi:hypothetical protein